MKRIFNQPICKTVCAKNYQGESNNCRLFSNVEACRMAEIIYPNKVNRALAWCSHYWPVVAFIAVVVSLFIFWSLIVYAAGSNTATKITLNELAAYSEQIEQQTNNAEWQRLWIKHGRPASVVYQPGEPPYYTNKDGVKCKFI